MSKAIEYELRMKTFLDEKANLAHSARRISDIVHKIPLDGVGYHSTLADDQALHSELATFIQHLSTLVSLGGTVVQRNAVRASAALLHFIIENKVYGLLDQQCKILLATPIDSPKLPAKSRWSVLVGWLHGGIEGEHEHDEG